MYICTHMYISTDLYTGEKLVSPQGSVVVIGNLAKHHVAPPATIFALTPPSELRGHKGWSAPHPPRLVTPVCPGPRTLRPASTRHEACPSAGIPLGPPLQGHRLSSEAGTLTSTSCTPALSVCAVLTIQRVRSRRWKNGVSR